MAGYRVMPRPIADKLLALVSELLTSDLTGAVLRFDRMMDRLLDPLRERDMVEGFADGREAVTEQLGMLRTAAFLRGLTTGYAVTAVSKWFSADEVRADENNAIVEMAVRTAYLALADFLRDSY